MARILGVEYLPNALGMSVRLRLEVAVVREGHLVMRRWIDSPLTDPTRRGREADPIFQAVTQSLETMLPDLVPVLVEAR